MPPTPNSACRRAAARAGLLLLAVLGAALARADDGAAIFAQTAPGYSRKKAADGSYLPETYTLGDGGSLPGTELDPSIDPLNFIDLAKVVTGPMEDQNFRPVPDRDPNHTQLLVMIYWGTTRAADRGPAATEELQARANAATAKPPPPPPIAGAQIGPNAGHDADRAVQMQTRQGDLSASFSVVGLEDRLRAEADLRTAELLGFDSVLGPSAGGFGPLENRRADLIAELEEPRYFIVLMAYDFDALWKHRRHILRWVARFSVRASGKRFDNTAGAMVAAAARYFGSSTGGLKRADLPQGRVDIGPVKSLGEVPTR